MKWRLDSERVKALAALAVVIFASLAWRGLGNRATRESVAARASAHALTEEAGYVGHLHAEGGDVPIGVGDGDYRALSRALFHHDAKGARDLQASRRAFFVPDGTQAVLVDRDGEVSQVRIAEGDLTGTSGWTAMEFLK